jgi:hypothetical protein
MWKRQSIGQALLRALSVKLAKREFGNPQITGTNKKFMPTHFPFSEMFYKVDDTTNNLIPESSPFYDNSESIGSSSWHFLKADMEPNF